MQILFYLLATIGIFMTLILVHELGHFLAAKYCRVKVLRFSLGLGRPLLRFHKGQTEWALGWLPLGGYVTLLDGRQGPVSKDEQAFDLSQKSISQRLLIIVMGPIMNLGFAWLCFWWVLMSGYPSSVPIIAEVLSDTPAAYAGMQAGDQIMAVDQTPVDEWHKANLHLMMHLTQPALTIAVKRFNQSSKILVLDLKHISLEKAEGNWHRSLGWIAQDPPEVLEKHYTFLAAIKQAGADLVLYTHFNFNMLYQLLFGGLSLSYFMGPLGLIQTTFTILEYPWAMIGWFMGLLSLAMAIFNSLPLPVLDGGHMMYLLIEKLTKRPVSLALQVLLYRWAMIIFIILLLQLTINDLLRWLTGGI